MPSKKDRLEAENHTIGQRIALFRRGSGLTQADLAKKLGITQQYVSFYELGRLRIPGALLPGLARALGISSDEILGMQRPVTNGMNTDRRFLRRLRRISQLTRHDRDALLSTIDAYLERRRIAAT